MVSAVAAPFILWRRGRRRVALVASAAVVLTFATYVAYTVFDDWWYIRFLIPALPILIVFTVITLRALADGIPTGPWWTLPVRGRSLLVLACATLVVWFLMVAVGRQVFRLQALESRFVIAGRYAGRALPSNAVVLSVQQSGSIRYHGGRATLTWDAIAPGDLDRTIAWLRASGRLPVIALEDAEEPRFRARFVTQDAGRLDWPPAVEVTAPIRVRIYDPAARAPFFADVRVDTTYVR
jgi:hypothetical protein